MKWLQSRPIHILILLLMLFMAIPAIGLVIHAEIQGRKEILLDSAKASSYLISTVATELASVIDSSQQMMAMMTLLPEVRQQNSGAVNSLLIDVLHKFPVYANIIMVDRNGRSWAAALPYTQPVSLADRKAFKEAKATGRFSSGEYVIGRSSQKPILNFAFPLKDQDGAFTGAVMFGINLERIGSLLKIDKMPAGTSVAIYDHKGTFLYRTLDANRFIGTKDKPENFEQMQNGPDGGVIDLISSDGMRRLSAYRKIRITDDQPPYAYIRGGTPVDPAIQVADTALIRNMIIMVLLVLSMFAGGLWISRRLIVTRIAALENASQDLANGNYLTRVADHVIGGELGRLAETFDAMADKLVQRERALASSERFLNAIIDTEPECIKLLDEECTLLLMNPAGLQMIEADSLDQVKGQCVCSLITAPHRDAFLSLTRQVFQGIPGTLEFEVVGIKGRHVWLETHAVPFRDEHEIIVALLGVTRDITDRKKAEQELLELNRELELRVNDRTAELEDAMVQQFCLNESLSRNTVELKEANRCLESFSYSVSHDLRAPLRHISGFAEILAETRAAHLDSEGKDLLARISKGCSRMDELITCLLDFSRLDRQVLQKELLDTKAVLTEVLAEIQSEYDKSSVELIIDALPPCFADYLLLKQVFANLLSNAFKYSSLQEIPRIEIGCTVQEDESIFFIRDNGTGFDMHYADNLFGVFQRFHGSEFEGTGIGLATVKRIIERHGGRIWAETAPGQGATFFFTLGA